MSGLVGHRVGRVVESAVQEVRNREGREVEDAEELVVRHEPDPARVQGVPAPVPEQPPVGRPRREQPLGRAALEVGAVEGILFEPRLVQADPERRREPERADRDHRPAARRAPGRPAQPCEFRNASTLRSAK